jgi:ATP-dependent Clp protease ATP-binding subunit ClpB
MNISRFTERSQDALRDAQTMATRRSHQGVDVEHLLLAMVQQTDGLASNVLEAAGAHVAALQERLTAELDRLPQVSGPAGTPEQLYVTQRLSRVLTRAEDEAAALKDEYVSIEHVLLAMLDERTGAGKLLRDQGVTRDSLMNALRTIRGTQRVTSPTPEATYQALERYGRDLTKLAAHGKLDPVIGRDEQIRRVIQVLSRRT